MTRPKLYSGTKNASSWAMRAWLALREAGVEFDEEVVDIRRPQRFVNLERISVLSPSATVPFLMTGKRVIFDSLAIMEFSNDLCGGRLLPSDIEQRACARSISAWQHAGLSSICAALSFESAFYPYKRKLSADEQAECGRLFSNLEELLGESGGPYLFGELSLADIALTPTVMRLLTHDPDMTQWKATLKWSRDLLDRPTVREWLGHAEPLPHIWFDEYLLPGSPIDLHSASEIGLVNMG